eukprot:15461586-Alexandrium_andersonii.AAC.1
MATAGMKSFSKLPFLRQHLLAGILPPNVATAVDIPALAQAMPSKSTLSRYQLVTDAAYML